MATVFCSTFIDLPSICKYITISQLTTNHLDPSARCSLAHLESDILGVDFAERKRKVERKVALHKSILINMKKKVDVAGDLDRTRRKIYSSKKDYLEM